MVFVALGSVLQNAGCAPAPRVAAAPTTPVEVGSSVETACLVTTEIAPLEMMSRELPPGASADEILDATARALVASGLKVGRIDRESGTIETDRFAGQTIESECGLSRYQVYALRVSVVGRSMLVSVDCWRSLGWNAHVANGRAVPERREGSETCELPAFVAKADALLPSRVIAGVEQHLGRQGQVSSR